MIGQVLGNYRIVSQLGLGGMGAVWLGEHQVLGSRAAIKVLLPEMSQHRKIVQRFFDEARAATRIQDPGIVTVLDFGWHEGSAYLVMENLVGETLGARVKRVGQLPVVQAVRTLQQCAIAMAAAHARGIIHRDLKPDNIFIVADPAVQGGERVKILDFGIAKLIDDADPGHSHTQTGMIMGTPAYMSPEQCRGAGGVDHRTDIYALGCVLFDMLCGRPPFTAGAPGDLIASHLRQEPPAPSSLVPGLPREIDELALRCLAKQPEQRFATMTELVRAGSAVTGENLSIETIPPVRAQTGRESEPAPLVRDTVATLGMPPVDTTLRGGTGELGDEPRRPWRGGAAIAVFAVVVVGVIAFAVTRGPSDSGQRPPAPHPTASPTAALVDAGVAPALAVDAAIEHATIAPPPAHPPAHPPKHPPPGTATHTGSAAGSGSGTGKPYDPYADR